MNQEEKFKNTPYKFEKLCKEVDGQPDHIKCYSYNLIELLKFGVKDYPYFKWDKEKEEWLDIC